MSMTLEQTARLEEALAAYRYLLMRLEFFEAFCAWMCLSGQNAFSESDNDIQLAHAALYTGLWVANPPVEDVWPVTVFMSKGAKGIN